MELIDVRHFPVTIDWKKPAASQQGSENVLHPKILFFRIQHFFEGIHVPIDLLHRRCAA